MAHDERHDDLRRESHERFWLPLVVPAAIILFAGLVIYGLSRIYLELDTWHYRDVGMATPLAIGIALVILLVSALLAARPVPATAVATLALLAASGLTGGAIWAAVHPDTAPAEVIAPTATEQPSGTPAGPGGVSVALADDPAFAVTADPASAPAGSVTFNVENVGTVPHNFNIVKTDLAPDALPVDSSKFQVDETQVDVIEKSSDLDAGNSESVEVALDPGSYVLFCNVPAHYTSGMHTAFTVQ